MTDTVLEHLQKLEAALVRDAEVSAEGPTTMTKSRFASEMERKSFINAYGQSAYDNLKD